VGSSTLKRFTGRLIFATNRNLKEMVELGEFRKDLYFRLRFFAIELPPLRQRKDLFQLIICEINNFKIKFNGARVTFAIDVMNKLVSYPWPGNYRELKNTIEYFYVLDRPNIYFGDIPDWIIDIKTEVTDLATTRNYYDALGKFEVLFLENLLIRNNGMVTISAEEAGISKVTLITKLKKYGIDRRSYKFLNKVDLADGF